MNLSRLLNTPPPDETSTANSQSREETTTTAPQGTPQPSRESAEFQTSNSITGPLGGTPLGGDHPCRILRQTLHQQRLPHEPHLMTTIPSRRVAPQRRSGSWEAHQVSMSRASAYT